jgi:glycerate 2-kinase
MYIQNYAQLISKSLNRNSLELRKIGLKALETAISSVEPGKLIRDVMKINHGNLIIQDDKYDLKKFERILIIGGGKATAQMAIALGELLKNHSQIEYEGLLNIPEDQKLKFLDSIKNIKLNFASHPIPNKAGLNGVNMMLELIEGATKEDLIICLFSGGGSALLPLPKKNITLIDIKKTSSLLLASGASIHEINTIRKHISDFKGGNLAKRIYESSKATTLSFIISDVIGNKLDSIASGPTIPDLTSFDDAYQILLKFNLLDSIPMSVKKVIIEGTKNPQLENPSKNDPFFDNVHTYLIGSVELSVEEVSNYLRKYNFEIDYFSKEISGEAADFGKNLYYLITKKLREYPKEAKKSRIAMIGTGELTVTLRGKGIGGRNQEMLLNFLNTIKGEKVNYNFFVIGCNLDGIEGNSKAMGAIVDNHLLSETIKNNIDIDSYLRSNNSNAFFKLTNGEIITGPTGINVNDFLLILVEMIFKEKKQ